MRMEMKMKEGKIRRFKNRVHKAKVILRVFRPGEMLTANEIAERLKNFGYDANPKELAMFLFHEMRHKYVEAEIKNGRRVYMLV